MTRNFLESDIVLVTGGNGHVAQHVIQQLLSIPHGPTVRASIRSQSAALKLETAFSSAISNKKLELFQIPDITIPGAYDEAPIGVTHMAHIASPLSITIQNIEKDLLIPAINGTVEILKSASRISTLKSVVITSSFAAIFDPAYSFHPGYTYTPQDYNPISYAEGRRSELGLDEMGRDMEAVYNVYGE